MRRLIALTCFALLFAAAVAANANRVSAYNTQTEPRPAVDLAVRK